MLNREGFHLKKLERPIPLLVSCEKKLEKIKCQLSFNDKHPLLTYTSTTGALMHLYHDCCTIQYIEVQF